MTALEAQSPVDAKTFWRVLSERATGMTVVTAQGEDGPAGFLGLSAAHVAADPPTLLVSVDAKTSALGAILARRHFAVNFLPAGAAHVADAFSGRTGLSGADRFVAGEWGALATGAPVFLGALGVFDCAVDQVVERGSISIVIGTVVGARAAGSGEPLVFFRGKTIAGLAEG
ncbi:flavin reductase family protein [Ancylobacter sp. TS-1]|uniref:flavin reductase family protein n=1 Tax=Ancylobacter sp. TS-1 TaxID=1850374 RepID=UPI001265BF98|nr:flavin reductase family protein [Ancylobacter sp. TS-1]QFR34939.1 flavin reductase [Ancylobacter sp. TS-1]